MEATDINAGGAPRLLKEVARRGLVLVVIVGALLAVCGRVVDHRPLGALPITIYIATVFLLVMCEYWLAFDRDWGSALRGSKTDLFYVINASLMDKATFAVCMTAVASIGRDVANQFQIHLWPSGWSLAAQVIVALLIADIATYFRHRMFHASSALWRFHRIHHSMTELYWIRSAYTHPLEQLCILTAIMLPIALLGAGEEVVAIVGLVFGLSGLLQHSNIDTRSTLLNYVLATPETHRIHHCDDDERSHSNYSAFFVFMDLLLGTYYRPSRSVAPQRVGLEGVTAFPRDFFTHLAMPFRGDPLETDGASAWESQSEASTASEP